jgi:putative transposase
MRKPYRTDLTDAQWELLKPLIPPAQPGGRPREVDLREVLKTLLDQARTSCPWEMLPHDLLPQSTVSDYFAQGRDDGTWQRIVEARRRKRREAAGRDSTPRVASLDRPTVQTTEVGGERGDDEGQKTSRRKRPLVFEARGLGLAVVVPAAAAEDGATAPRRRGLRERPRSPRLEVVDGDGKYTNRQLDDWSVRRKVPFRVEGGSVPKVRRGSYDCRSVGWRSGASPGWVGTGGRARTPSGIRSRVRRGSRSARWAGCSGVWPPARSGSQHHSCTENAKLGSFPHSCTGNAKLGSFPESL